ncbi:MAG: adenylate/guanylate cyclase domain-containing protein [Alphaproteobacteria bacterium]|nr:adenylate/guanylate cyclase domain-containing protein [Alphaproteobacteria bacterium]
MFERRYLRRCLILLAPAAASQVAIGFFGGAWAVIAPALVAELIGLAATIVLIGHLLFRPICLSLSVPSVPFPIEEFRRLPGRSVWLALAVTLIATLVDVVGLPMLGPGDALAAIPTPTIAVRVAVWWLLLPTLVFFLVADLGAVIRSHLFQTRGLVVPPLNGTLMRRMMISLLLVAALPGAVMLADSFNLNEIADRLWIAPYWVIGGDFVIVLALLGFTFVTIGRTFRRPLERLSAAVADLRDGRLDARAPVLTDDEIGQLTHTFNAMVDGLRERDIVREAFGKFVNPRIARTILEKPEKLAGDVREETILSTDIERFTTITETIPPKASIDLLNEYFRLVMEPIGRFGGVITNFTGDSLLAAFNVPEEDPEHAANVVRAALAIEHLLLGRTFTGGITLRTRIGINTGLVVAGAVGASDRLGYTILGDVVNLTARLEQRNKQFGTLILVSEATANRAGSAFRLEPMGEVAVRGRAAPVRAFTVIAG